MTVLERFSAPTRAWFAGSFVEPTAAQAGAWDAISTGGHALVVAPTGSGKTLAAFLWSIDRLLSGAPGTAPVQTDAAASAGTRADGTPSAPNDPADDAASPDPVDGDRPRTRVLYISPLKALGVDVERNLRSPLVGISQAATRLGVQVPDIRVGVRSGDTTPQERRSLQRTPPDILITTPESLFLMLTSAARESLRAVDTVIVDEVHAVAGTKRGAHLALSLERLDALLPTPAQRIGLSATVRPREEVARFLGGAAAVQVIAPPSSKRFDLRVVVPVDDLTELDARHVRGTDASASVDTGDDDFGDKIFGDDDFGDNDFGDEADAAPTGHSGSIWPHVEEEIVDRVLAARSTIVFANSRRLAERLTARLNEIVEERAAESADSRLEGAAADASRGGVAAASGSIATSGLNGMPAALMGQSGRVEGAPAVLARAHHGSVSREQRAVIEDDLKSGRLRCVVATSSLELGIDMGAVDQVIQVESPPSVASGLQRIGRAGHGVGEVSRGVIIPQHRADLVHAAVTSERMTAGLIERLAVPANPLDVLAQQTVAAVALDVLDVEQWYQTVRRSAPFATLPRSAFDATLDLLAGRYPSDEFAQLRPRLVWDRVHGTLTGRPGAQRLAVTSGGTIPDRGLFGVFIVGDEAGGRRVGELDEEMVYESRVGDVFALGTTSWRIEEITHDRVLVSPAFGQPARVPFWKGDTLGRPMELGEAVGAFTREVAASGAKARDRLAQAGLDSRAADNLIAYVDEQRQATGTVPSDTALVVERFRDELGDWRLVLHSPYGMNVHAPWAIAVSARIRERYGVDAAADAADDGVVVRLPETDAEPPGAELFVFEPDELTQLVTDEVGGSALFAARFRECAARALLLPRLDPGRRSPLWQQRQRASQLLAVAAKYPTFPIVLETVREVLQDVYDLPGLVAIATRIAERRISLTEVETQRPSPFARSLLFGYVMAFMYEGDSPLAEKRAAALALDPTLLAELLGRTELRELLDPGVIEQVRDELQRLAPDRRARDAEGITDLLRGLGPLTDAEIAARSTSTHTVADDLTALETAGRVIRVRIAGDDRWAVIEDAARLRDALGAAMPMGVPSAFLEPVPDPVGDLVSRYARTTAPFTAMDVATRLGLGVAVVHDALRRLAADRRVAEGEFTPAASGSEWVDAEVLRRLRARSLAALRREVEPVPADALARFLPAWQHVGSPLRGLDGVATVIEQLAGVPLPASAWERLVLPSRVRDYSPALLDELTTSGEVLWAGAGSLPGNDGWVSLHLADSAAATLPLRGDGSHGDLPPEGSLGAAILSTLAGGGGYFFRQLSDAVGAARGVVDDTDLAAVLWELVWAGRLTNDSFAPLRAMTGGTSRTPRPRIVRGRGRVSLPSRTGPPSVSGRWSLTPEPVADPTVRAAATAEQLLERHGVVTRGAVQAEQIPGGFALVYRVLKRFEESGRARRGYFVAGLGAAQFATGATVDRLRSFARDPDAATTAAPVAITLAATDPANPFGAALPWPATEGHRPGRKAGALVCLVDGALVLFIERGGRSTITFSDDSAVLAAAATSLAATVRGGLGSMRIERIDGDFSVGTAFGAQLIEAGFSPTPRGLRMRA